jgi:hypothetical protein
MWEALEHAGWVSTLATSRSIYGVVSVIHHASVLFSIGTIVLLDLRILGPANQQAATSALAEQLRPWTWIGIASALISGFLLFASQAAAYVAVTPFRVKMLTIVLAVIAALAVEWSVAKWDRARVMPTTARMLALISIVLWLGALLAAVEISELTGLG